MERLQEFSERLKELLILNNETVKTVSKNCSITASSLYGYLCGDHIPSLENVHKIADYFECSLDYLFGFSDKKERQNFHAGKTLSERLEQAIFEYKKSRYMIAKDFDFSESQLYRWCHGKSQPSLANLVKLAEALDCSLDFLAG